MTGVVNADSKKISLNCITENVSHLKRIKLLIVSRLIDGCAYSSTSRGRHFFIQLEVMFAEAVNLSPTRDVEGDTIAVVYIWGISDKCVI